MEPLLHVPVVVPAHRLRGAERGAGGGRRHERAGQPPALLTHSSFAAWHSGAIYNWKGDNGSGLDSHLWEWFISIFSFRCDNKTTRSIELRRSKCNILKIWWCEERTVLSVYLAICGLQREA